MKMKFADILNNQKLWSVVYDNEAEDILSQTLSAWMNPLYLREFFERNFTDLAHNFHITNIDQAIFDTVADSASLSCLILDISPDANLDLLFRPLENSRISEMQLSREKAKGKRISGHPSWLRLYAIKMDSGIYIITGGAIKLTHLMNEREHTLRELQKMEMVRSYLIERGIFDVDGVIDNNNEK